MIKSTKNRHIAHRLFKCQSVWVWTRQKFFSVGEIVMLGLDFSSWSSSQFFSLPLCGIRLPMRLMFLHCYLRNMESLSSRSGFSRGGFHARCWNLQSGVIMSFLEARETALCFTRDFFDKCYGGLNETVRFDFRNSISGGQPSSSSTIDM